MTVQRTCHVKTADLPYKDDRSADLPYEDDEDFHGGLGEAVAEVDDWFSLCFHAAQDDPHEH